MVVLNKSEWQIPFGDDNKDEQNPFGHDNQQVANQSQLEGAVQQVAAIALGSNLPSPFGGPTENLREAIRRIEELGHVLAISRFHVTAPVGYADQPDFLNAALLLETNLKPAALMQTLLQIELDMGRDRSGAIPPKGPRTIDLDLLLVDGLVLHGPVLTLPHPEMARRRFVLEPLAEIAPEMTDPVSGLSVKELLARLGG